jgi:hypothetical protein
MPLILKYFYSYSFLKVIFYSTPNNGIYLRISIHHLNSAQLFHLVIWRRLTPVKGILIWFQASNKWILQNQYAVIDAGADKHNALWGHPATAPVVSPDKLWMIRFGSSISFAGSNEEFGWRGLLKTSGMVC